jgi:general secretion pathway protein L
MNDYSNAATLQMLNIGKRFGRWIKGCVAALVDDIAGSAGDASGSRTMIMVAEDSTEVYGRGKPGGRELMIRLEGSSAAIASRLKRELKRSSRKNVLVRIAGERAVVKEIPLPVGALDVMPAIIRNKVESLAPWPLQEAMWGYRVSGPPQSGQIGVMVGIVSRKTLDGVLTMVQQADVKASFLDIGRSANDTGSIAIDFLGSGRTIRARRLVTAAMSVAALIALGAASYGLYKATSAYAELAAVERRTADLRQALVGKAGGGETGAKLVEANKLYVRKQESRPVVIILNSLTKLVPDGTWLNSIDYSGNQLTIAGRGVEIPKVIESLEKSDVFASVNFASATQRDPNLNADIFSISATIETKGSAQ